MRKTAILALGVLLALPVGLQGQSRSACPPQGSATKAKAKKLNELRARVDEPSDDDYDDTVDMSDLIDPGDDSQRWSNNSAAEITAFVVDVRDGGMASSNCFSPDPADHDTVLELSSGADVSDASHRVLAVITPRWRRIMAKNQIDWSTRAIRALYWQKYVSIRGWLLFDADAASRAVNTASLAGASITRATAWEIHPVTGIEPSEEGLEQQTRLDEPGPFLYARSNARSSAP
ncbi:MAG TPA: hypothetical protein VKG23_01100 [Thermoanaerobaculia bacterium]|nr:hypothetical protein [Thermoanaerobaculia bacterium]